MVSPARQAGLAARSGGPFSAGTLVAIIAAAWFWPGSTEARNQRQHLVIYALVAVLLDLAISQVMGHVWVRDRPYVHHSVDLLVGPSGDPSFPSDHAVGGFALAVPFVLARRRMGWILLGLAPVLALARVPWGRSTRAMSWAAPSSAAARQSWYGVCGSGLSLSSHPACCSRGESGLRSPAALSG
jgi:hypothetical protein